MSLHCSLPSFSDLLLLTMGHNWWHISVGTCTRRAQQKPLLPQGHSVLPFPASLGGGGENWAMLKAGSGRERRATGCIHFGKFSYLTRRARRISAVGPAGHGRVHSWASHRPRALPRALPRPHGCCGAPTRSPRPCPQVQPHCAQPSPHFPSH